MLLLYWPIVDVIWLLHVERLILWLHDVTDGHLLHCLRLLYEWNLLHLLVLNALLWHRWLLLNNGLLCLGFDFLLVGLQVTGEIELGKESPLTVVAGESLLALMDLHVLVQVSLLGESVVAIWEIALVRPLLGVDSEMVEEVVPLPEHFGAVAVGAAEQPYDSSSLWAFILIDDEVLCTWDVLLDVDLIQVKVLSMLHSNSVVIWDHFSLSELGIDVKVELILDLGLGQFDGV